MTDLGMVNVGNDHSATGEARKLSIIEIGNFNELTINSDHIPRLAPTLHVVG